MKAKSTNKTNPKPQPVNKEAFKMLAMEIGLNAASRKLGVPIPTGKSWAQRGGWKLPKRNGGGKPLELVASGPHPVADALVEAHESLATSTRTALAQTLAKAAQQVSKEEALPVKNTAQLRDVCLAAARLFGWDGNAHPSVTYYGDDNRQVIVCPPERRQELIEQRQRLLEQEATLASSREVETAAPVTLLAPETRSSANVGTGNDIVVQEQDPISRHMESIRNADTWRSEPENHAGMFGPHPEEIY
jgi:hypothetical protein